ncbi:MAG: terminase large subunit [Oscillospiraceae bacterium]|jgi:phage terminase large subunit-like protein|nr:terminase large subunit [Oscillospiraceae bacterium]
MEFSPTRFMLPDSHYSAKRADHAVRFIEQLRHVKTSQWAGKPFKLLPWQEEIIRNIFGVIKADGTRQFRHVFVEVPKKSGKSELAAAVALYLLCADREQGAEIFSVANDREQAAIVFNLAMQMAADCPFLRARCKFIDSRKRIVFEPTRSFYAAISSEVKNKYGLNVHGCIFDELLGQTDRNLYDTMTMGATSARLQPLNFVITTAGRDRTSVCYEEHCYALDLLEGRKEDSNYYPCVFAAKDDDDWTDSEVWKRVNPSFGITVPEDFYHNFFRRAQSNVALEMEFRQFYLGQWLSSDKSWLPMDKYDKCAAPFDPLSLKGNPCFAGLDLASTDDIAAMVLVFPPENENGEYFVLPHFWIPRENMQRRTKQDHVLYEKWAREDFLHVTEGNIIHYDFIEKQIKDASERYDLKQVCYDKWNSSQLIAHLEAAGIKTVRIGQGFESLSQPSKDLHRLILDEKFRHGGNPVLRWMMENVVIEMDAAANIKPNKKKSREKIDGVAATIMALRQAMVPVRPAGGLVRINFETGEARRNGVVL